MPEIAEVSRLVHFLRLHLVGKKIIKSIAPDDAVIFGKVGASGPAFEAATRGRTVVTAGSQGKYFWITLNRPPHIVMHLGMTGWIHIRGERTGYTRYYNKPKTGGGDAGDADDADPDPVPDPDLLWPPRFCKFQLETEDGTEFAFTDPRRFGRIRLVDCPGAEIRAHPPLADNGPDPVVDAAVFTPDFLRDRVRSRRVPIKSLLLDQVVVSGLGNWVCDEVLFQSRLHPGRYCTDLTDAEVDALHGSIRDVCQTAVDKLGDSEHFPDHWLFNHRWGKGKMGSRLPDGTELAFIVVAGRTTCIAPALQLKHGGRPGSATIKSKPARVKKTSTKTEETVVVVVKSETDAEDSEPAAADEKQAAGPSHKRRSDDAEIMSPPPADRKKKKKQARSDKGKVYMALGQELIQEQVIQSVGARITRSSARMGGKQ